MRSRDGELQISASDLAKHLTCRHPTALDLQRRAGRFERPYWHDPNAKIQEERGGRQDLLLRKKPRLAPEAPKELYKIDADIIAEQRGLRCSWIVAFYRFRVRRARERHTPARG